MLRLLVLLLLASGVAVSQTAALGDLLREKRSSQGDLEVAGDLAGFPAGTTRYVRYEDLLRLPQETFTVTDDTNFKGAVEITGISLARLTEVFGQQADLIVAICYDKYRTNYTRNYMATHHPVLVLLVNGRKRDNWPLAEGGASMGPFVITHPAFKPAFKVLSHEDEPQIPYGVTRLEFRKEKEVFGAIRPASQWRDNRRVQQGYVIARQDCFRCHNMGAEGGTMAGRSWLKLAEVANVDGQKFRRVIHNPAAVNPTAKMPAHSDYDSATLDALTAYFRTFATQKSHIEGKTTE